MVRQLSAGVARVDMTPPIGVAHANWGAQLHQRAAGIDLPLWATALALSDGDQTVVIVDLDLGSERRGVEMREATAKLTGLPLSHIRLSYTHTHSGAAGSPWVEEGLDVYEQYLGELVHQVAGVAWAAIRDLRPARIGAGSGSCQIGVNRRFQRPEDGRVICGHNWDGPMDPEVKVVRIDELQGKPLATIVNYACHGTTVGPDNDLITPDYPGMVKRVVGQATGGTCLFLQGAAANVENRRGLARGGIHEYKRLGAILGYEASRVWWEMELPERRERYVETLESGAPLAVYAEELLPDPDATLQVGDRQMRLPLKELRDPEPLEAELAKEVARLNELRASGADPEEIRWQTMVAKRITRFAKFARRHKGQTHTDVELQIFAIGKDIALVAIPGELFCEIGMAVKQDSPFKHTLFSSYSNIGGGYMPMPDAYPLGGHEVEGTPYSPDAAGQVIQESLALLRELAASAQA